MTTKDLRSLLVFTLGCLCMTACQPQAVPAGSGAQIKILRLAMSGGDFLTLDPALASDAGTLNVVRQAFVGLTRDDEQTAEVLPGIAESWDISEDGKTYTFHLRQGIPWVTWDGQRVVEVRDCQDPPAVRWLTALDFAYGIQRSVDPATAAPYAFVLAQVIEGAEARAFGDGAREDVQVRALDDFTLQVTFVRPAANNLAIIGLWTGYAQPKWLIEGDECTTPTGDQWADTGHFQSYGPFTLKSWVRDTDLTIVKNPFWPGIGASPQAKIDEVVFKLLEDSQALQLYEVGDLESVGVPIGNEDRMRAHPIYSKELDTGPTLCTGFYGFNTHAAYVDDVRVRRALSMAIERQALIDNVAKYGQEAARWFSRPGLNAAPTLEGFPDLGIGFDPEAARRELQAYLDEKGLQPQDLDITFMYSRTGSTEKLANAVQSMWKENLGLNIKLDSQEWNYFLATVIHPDFAPQIFSLDWCADYPDAHNFLHDVFAKGGATNPKEGGGINWLNPEFERLIQEAAVEDDLEARTQLYAQAEEILVDTDAAIAPLWWGTRMVLTKPYVLRTVGSGGVDSFEKWDILPTPVASGE